MEANFFNTQFIKTISQNVASQLSSKSEESNIPTNMTTRPSYRILAQAQIQAPAPQWTAPALVGEEVKQLSLKAFKDSYLLMFMYPSNALRMCQQELTILSELAKKLPSEFKVVAISTDSLHAHRVFSRIPSQQGGIAPISNIPLVSDSTHDISAAYGLLTPEGTSMSATVIVDKAGILRSVSVNDPAVGRSFEDIERVANAIQTADKSREYCPANWKVGSKTSPSQAVDAKIYFPQATSA